MRMTRECDYAFVALVFLAGRGEATVISCEEMARELAIPEDFLAKILQKLSRAELIVSKQGPRGGYSVSRNPSEISFADVFRAIDDPMRLVECVEIEECRCPRVLVCAIIETMLALHEKVMANFERLTVADLVPSSDQRSSLAHARESAALGIREGAP